MSVMTRCDELKHEVEDHTSESIVALNQFLAPDTWGNDEYDDEFIEKMECFVAILRKQYRILFK